MQTYNGRINEFVDWVSGVDSRTNVNVTSGMPASGSSIRLLLQSRLHKPFVKYDDTKGGQYIFFSSEDAKDEWLRLTNSESIYYDPEKASTIPITTMARPADTAIEVKSISTAGAEGDISDARYIISGDENSSEANIRYIVRMFKELGGSRQSIVDPFVVTFTITDANGGQYVISEDYNSNRVTTTEHKILSFNCYQYLAEGANNINVIVSSKNSGAIFSTNITVYLVRFNISSTFDFSKAVQEGGVLRVPVTVNRSVQGMTMNIYAKMSDGSSLNKVFNTVASVTTNSSDNPYTTTLEILNDFQPNMSNEDHIKHTLSIEATLGSGGSATLFTSNVLFFTVETASPQNDLVNKFINIKYDTPSNQVYQSNGNIILHANQFEPFSLDWSYYTDHLNYETSIDVLWYLRYKDGNEYKEVLVGSGSGIKERISDTLEFIPEVFLTQEDGASLIAKYTKNGSNITIDTFPIIIAKSVYTILEASEAVFKLSAFGKSNTAPDKEQWIDSISGATTTFNNVTFDNRCGWDTNGLVIQGLQSSAVVNYCPITSNYNLASLGKTIEIEFIPIKSNDDNDTLIRIGDPDAGHIDIKPTGAYLYIGNSTTDIIHTNYKVGERIKLAFVFNTSDGTSTYENGLVYIINNGILERAAEMGYAGSYGSDNGNIVIGGTESSVKVYNMRIYNKPLTYTQELNNFIYDSTNKSPIIARNQLFGNDELDFELTKNKIDSILIEGLAGSKYGGLSKILSKESTKKGSESTVNIKRTCISDESKSFYISKAMIRKHGQSTINYPITALKFWLNKSATDGDNPTFTELPESQRALNLNKNRYLMKSGSIPANKFVLQANYADSSGTHNGSLLRLIQDTWYNAAFGSNNEYKLRTAPLLFASGKTVVHNNENIGEDGTWIDGYGVNAAVGKTWPQLTGKEFPYTIRNAADSFPCAVFYKDPNGDGRTHFLGQYVFMDDKKSDYCYGERSIYAFGDFTDPFVMNIDNTKNGINGKQDTSNNCVWDNGNVLRIEVVLPNTNVTSYMGMNVPATLVVNDQGDIESVSGAQVPCTDIKYDNEGNPVKFYWEDYFEMIYPDPDDVEVEKINNVETYTKFNPDSKFRRKALPFIDFLTWITGIAALNVDSNDRQYTDGTVNQAALNRFKAEAHDHLDLYKLAAYYIFFLRFGLVDSVERNALLKTYDGQHWHYEPWDMDIALGNTNQGALVLNPPLTRDSVIPGTSTKAFSGRGASTSNFMWDCLEAWDYWSDVLVPEVAEALYKAGLTYDNVIKMFDGNYSDKWAESLYNEAGYFKYIKNGGGDYLPWLQGSRVSHRHWWLSTSMNYYDAKWSCGTFKDRRVVLFVDKGINSAGTDIVRIKPTGSTYFEITASGGDSSIERKSATPANPALFDISPNSFSAKDPTWIFGGSFIEELDLSCFAKTMATVDVSLCYDSVLGANIKYLNIGVPTTGNGTTKTGSVSGTKLRISAVDSFTGQDAFEELLTLDVTGQSSISTVAGIFTLNNRTSIRNFYAAGTSIISFENAPSGNTFDNLVLPAQTQITNADSSVSTSNINSFVMHNASWSNLEFWNTTATSTPVQVVDEHGDPVFVEDEEGNNVPVYEPASATYTKQTAIPSTLNTVVFDGSTARNEGSIQFLLDWIHSVATTLPSYNSSNDTWDSAELHNELKRRSFRAENVNWTSAMSTRLTYTDLENIAYLNGTSTVAGIETFNNNTFKYIKGYVVLSGALTAEQMVNIKKWFGDSAFDKSARNSQLVVDSTSSNVVINIDGVTIENNVITLEEGNTASMLGTKFLLGESVGENLIIDTGQELGRDQFIWAIADGTNFNSQNANNLIWGSSYNSCELQYNESDGRMHLIASEGDFGDYDIVVRVNFINDNDMQDYSYLTMKVIGTTYPTDYSISVSGSGIREFHVDDTTYRNLFPGYYSYGGNTVNAYVLYSPNQQMTVNITPQGSYTAKIKETAFNIFKVSTTMSVVNGYQNIETVNTAGYTTMLGSDEYIGYNSNGSSKFAVSVVAGPDLPQDCTTYQVRVRISAGARAAQYKVINIVVINDANYILAASTSNGVYSAIINKYNTDYNLPVANYNLYKTHLMGISGALSFTNYVNTVTSLESARGDSVLLYLPNVTELDFTDCTSWNDSISMLNFTNNSKLTTLSLNNCNKLTGVVNTTGATSLTSLDLRNTTLSVNLPANNRIESLQLGTPTSVAITNPTVLGNSGTTVTIQSKQDINDIRLTNCNTTNVHGFNIFDTLY